MLHGLIGLSKTIAWFWLAALVGWPGAAPAGPADGREVDPVLAAVQAELERSLAALGEAPETPYFTAIEVTEIERIQLVAEEGALQGWAPHRVRWVDVDLRLGSPELDSTHPLRGAGGSGRRGGRNLPLGDDQAVLQRLLWREIDGSYKDARESWAKVQSDRQTLVKETEQIEDLAPAATARDLRPPVRLELDTQAWSAALRRASARLVGSRVSHDGNVSLRATAVNRWFVNTEGSRLRHGELRYRVTARVNTVAEDGDRLLLQRDWEAHDPQGLPDPEVVAGAVAELERQLADLRAAPTQPPYSGPAVLSGRAAAVFFHEIMGHRMEGHRLKQVKDAQTFRDKLGELILPTFLSVYDDPRLERHGDQALLGHYRYDNQGVPAQRAELVDHGVLEGFLESRSPSRAGVRSNGHGRRQPGLRAVTRQGVLVIEAHETHTEEQLREQLLEQVRRAGLEYGLWLDEIHGGFTFTGRTIPNAFNVRVVAARRIYADDRPDELVRGIDFIGTPLVTFSRIVAASDRPAVFNGYCGAESGSVPVSAIAPDLLLSQIETQRKARRQNMPPLLPPPNVEPEGGGS